MPKMKGVFLIDEMKAMAQSMMRKVKGSVSVDKVKAMLKGGGSAGQVNDVLQSKKKTT